MTGHASAGTRKFGLVGTFDVDNYGDCLFPELYAWLLEQRFGDCRVTLYSPNPIAAEILSFEKVEALPGSAENCRFEEDVLILTGGETLIVGHGIGTYIGPLSQMSPLLRLWLAPLVASKQSSLRFAAHCVGLPHANAELLADIGEALTSADWVTLRDRSSADRLGRRFGLGVDPVFLVPEMRDATQWKRLANPVVPPALAGKRFMVGQISYPYIAGDLAGFCRSLLEIAKDENCDILLMPICHFLDDDLVLERCREILIDLDPAWADRVHMAAKTLPNVLETTAVLSISSGYVGTSLHGAVVAIAFGKPIASLGGSGGVESKQRQTLRTAGIEVGVVERIRDLPSAFRASKATDLAAGARTAMKRARNDIDALFDRIEAEDWETCPALDPAVLDRLVRADRDKVDSKKLLVKRAVILALRKWPGLYRSYRRARLRKVLQVS